MRKNYTILLLIFITLTAYSQNKEICGDTAFWYKRNKELYEKINLPNLEKSDKGFHFRLSYYGQVIDIWKDNDSIGGKITNYVYHTYGKIWKKRETLFKQQNITDTAAQKAYNLIYDSKIMQMPDNNNITGWIRGFDGITYFIGYADTQTVFYNILHSLNLSYQRGKGFFPEACMGLFTNCTKTKIKTY